MILSAILKFRQNYDHRFLKPIHFLLPIAFYRAFEFSLLRNAPIISRLNFLWGTVSNVTPDPRSQHPISVYHGKRTAICLAGGYFFEWLHVGKNKKFFWHWLSFRIYKNNDFLKSIYYVELRVFSISSFSSMKRKCWLLAMTIWLPFQHFRSFHSF